MENVREKNRRKKRACGVTHSWKKKNDARGNDLEKKTKPLNGIITVEWFSLVQAAVESRR